MELEALYQETDGNPFFVEEMVRHLSAEGQALTGPWLDGADWGVPEGVRHIISLRVARLSGDARSVLQAGAVLGSTGFGKSDERFAGVLFTCVTVPGKF